MSGFVYVVASSSGLFKIGYTNDPRRRLSMLRTSTADDLQMLGVIEGTEDHERALHEMLAPWRVAREWFRPCRAISYLLEQATPVAPRGRKSGLSDPISMYSRMSGQTLGDIAKAAGSSRMTLWRIARGKQQASIGVLKRISEATGGAVSVTAIMASIIEAAA
jgi:hypothetical protein